MEAHYLEMDTEEIARGAFAIWQKRNHTVTYLLDPDNESGGEGTRQMTPDDAVRIYFTLHHDPGLTDLFWLGPKPAPIHPAAAARLAEMVSHAAAIY